MWRKGSTKYWDEGGVCCIDWRIFEVWLQAETTGAPSAPYFPGVSSSPDQRRRRRRRQTGDDVEGEGEVKIRVKRRGVGGLGGQKGGYAFKGETNFVLKMILILHQGLSGRDLLLAVFFFWLRWVCLYIMARNPGPIQERDICKQLLIPSDRWFCRWLLFSCYCWFLIIADFADDCWVLRFSPHLSACLHLPIYWRPDPVILSKNYLLQIWGKKKTLVLFTGYYTLWFWTGKILWIPVKITVIFSQKLIMWNIFGYIQALWNCFELGHRIFELSLDVCFFRNICQYQYSIPFFCWLHENFPPPYNLPDSRIWSPFRKCSPSSKLYEIDTVL